MRISAEDKNNGQLPQKPQIKNIKAPFQALLKVAGSGFEPLTSRL